MTNQLRGSLICPIRGHHCLLTSQGIASVCCLRILERGPAGYARGRPGMSGLVSALAQAVLQPHLMLLGEGTSAGHEGNAR